MTARVEDEGARSRRYRSGITSLVAMTAALGGLAAPIAVTSSAEAATTVAVARGDSLWTIARTSGTTVAAVRAANGLRGDLIHPGQRLVVGGPAPATAARAAPAPSAASQVAVRQHVIRRGDSLWKIARAYGVSVDALMAANSMHQGSLLLPGRTMVVPSLGTPVRPVASVTAAAPATPSTAPGRSAVPLPVARQDGIPIPTVTARNKAVLQSLPRPDTETVKATVVRVARRLGLDPSLALAVAYHESRFQQHVISATSAIGTMQVLPATARWVSTTVAGRELNPFLLEDNVTAGLLSLKWLLDRLPTDQAIAAYYQGISSVKAQGASPAGQAYVAEIHRYQARFR